MQFSLQSFLFGSLAVGAAFGLAIAQPIVLYAVLVVLLLGLLILFALIPWLPLIELFAEKDLEQQELICANVGGVLSEQSKDWQIRGWIAFVVGFFILLSSDLDYSLELVSERLLLTLGSYAAGLLTMLVLSLLIVPWMSIGRLQMPAPGSSSTRLAIGCLARFQLRGLLALSLLSFILIWPLFAWVRSPN